MDGSLSTSTSTTYQLPIPEKEEKYPKLLQKNISVERIGCFKGVEGGTMEVKQLLCYPTKNMFAVISYSYSARKRSLILARYDHDKSKVVSTSDDFIFISRWDSSKFIGMITVDQTCNRFRLVVQDVESKIPVESFILVLDNLPGRKPGVDVVGIDSVQRLNGDIIILVSSCGDHNWLDFVSLSRAKIVRTLSDSDILSELHSGFPHPVVSKTTENLFIINQRISTEDAFSIEHYGTARAVITPTLLKWDSGVENAEILRYFTNPESLYIYSMDTFVDSTKVEYLIYGGGSSDLCIFQISTGILTQKFTASKDYCTWSRSSLHPKLPSILFTGNHQGKLHMIDTEKEYGEEFVKEIIEVKQPFTEIETFYHGQGTILLAYFTRRGGDVNLIKIQGLEFRKIDDETALADLKERIGYLREEEEIIERDVSLNSICITGSGSIKVLSILLNM